MKEDFWKLPVEEEMNSILKNQTWDLAPSLVNCKPMGLKWVFKVKKNSKREVMRQKASLVVKGYSLKYGIDYDEVFAPMPCFEFICMIIPISAQTN